MQNLDWICDECNKPLEDSEIGAALITGRLICQACDHEENPEPDDTDEVLCCESCGEAMDSEEIKLAIRDNHAYCEECVNEHENFANGFNRLMLAEVDTPDDRWADLSSGDSY